MTRKLKAWLKLTCFQCSILYVLESFSCLFSTYRTQGANTDSHVLRGRMAGVCRSLHHGKVSSFHFFSLRSKIEFNWNAKAASDSPCRATEWSDTREFLFRDTFRRQARISPTVRLQRVIDHNHGPMTSHLRLCVSIEKKNFSLSFCLFFQNPWKEDWHPDAHPSNQTRRPDILGRRGRDESVLRLSGHRHEGWTRDPRLEPGQRGGHHHL